MTEVERLGLEQGLPPWIWAEHVARFQFAASMVAGKRVIDCECGSGLGTRYLAEAGSVEIRAYDVSESAVARARSEVRAVPHPRSEEALVDIAKRWGSVSGCGCAEAFELIRSIRRAAP